MYGSLKVLRALAVLGVTVICAISVDAENGASGQVTLVNHANYSSDSRYDGLVGYWNFDEGTGDIAYDHSGNNNRGFLRNGPVWAAGISGGCLEFDGIDDYVEVLDAPGLDISGTEISFMAWVKSSSYHDFGWIMGYSGRSNCRRLASCRGGVRWVIYAILS
jgi:hypothetical protein